MDHCQALGYNVTPKPSCSLPYPSTKVLGGQRINGIHSRSDCSTHQSSNTVCELWDVRDSDPALVPICLRNDGLWPLGRNLSNNQLTGSIPSVIGQLINLEELLVISRWRFLKYRTHSLYLHRYLYSNQLTGSIPETFGQLVNLRGM